MENSLIAWTHHTQNFWVGCDKIAPECAHCYIERTLRQQHRPAWGQLFHTQTWSEPDKWEREAAAAGVCYRIFTNSLSDFFHAGADLWRDAAWDVIRRTPYLTYLILTKRPELIANRLPADWGGGWANVWLGVSSGCKQTLNKMESLRRIPVHARAVRFLSAEPLLEDIAADVDLNGFGWVIVGGESGTNPAYLWDPTANWRVEFDLPGRRIMELDWAHKLRERCRAAQIPFFFKQVTAFRSEQGKDALGPVIQQVPPPYMRKWAERGSTVIVKSGDVTRAIEALTSAMRKFTSETKP